MFRKPNITTEPSDGNSSIFSLDFIMTCHNWCASQVWELPGRGGESLRPRAKTPARKDKSHQQGQKPSLCWMSTATKTQNSGFEAIVSCRIGRHFLFQIFITDKDTRGLLSSAKELSVMLTFSKTQILMAWFLLGLLTEASKLRKTCRSDQDFLSTQRWHQKLICWMCSKIDLPWHQCCRHQNLLVHRNSFHSPA